MLKNILFLLVLLSVSTYCFAETPKAQSTQGCRYQLLFVDYGLFMIDTTTGNVWEYRTVKDGINVFQKTWVEGINATIDDINKMTDKARHSRMSNIE